MNSIDKQFKQLGKQTLPPPLEGHQLRFQRKLQQQNKPIVKMMTWISIAAIIAVIIGLSSASLENQTSSSHELTHFYEAQIDHQLQVLEMSYEEHYAVPFQDIRKQLSFLDEDYQSLQQQFDENHQHPLILKAMIDNLQQRLDILNELENKLNELKTDRYENELL